MIPIFGSVHFNICHLEGLSSAYIISYLHYSKHLLICGVYQFVILIEDRN